MRTLPATYKKNGYEFTQIRRQGSVVMAEQRVPGNGKLIAYEVFEVVIQPQYLKDLEAAKQKAWDNAPNFIKELRAKKEQEKESPSKPEVKPRS